MSASNERGFRSVLANSNFRALWMAQLCAQTSQHAIHFIQMVLVEQLTGSAMHIGFTILAFSLPGVIFSPVAGVVVDRFSKKWVLVLSNLTRVVLAAGYIVVLNTLQGTWELLAFYALTFLTATLAQFFSPAEAATIPLLVGEERLFTANSLFTLTMVISQALGLLVLGPLAVGLVNVQGGFVIIAGMYLLAAVLVFSLPTDHPPAKLGKAEAASPRQRLWNEFREGLAFISGRSKLQAAMVQLVTITTLVMVMAMLAPGYAARVLGMAPQNAVIVFAPAGLGMLAATALVGRWGHWLRRINFGPLGLFLVGLGFAAMGLLSLDYQILLRPILQVYPQAAFSLTSATIAIGFALGLGMSAVNILSQTVLQQESPAYIRGRVFSVQFMLNNLVGIPPMLILGGVADIIGIPRVMVVTGAGTLVLALVSLLIGRGRISFQGRFERDAASPAAPPAIKKTPR